MQTWDGRFWSILVGICGTLIIAAASLAMQVYSNRVQQSNNEKQKVENTKTYSGNEAWEKSWSENHEGENAFKKVQ